MSLGTNNFIILLKLNEFQSLLNLVSQTNILFTPNAKLYSTLFSSFDKHKRLSCGILKSVKSVHLSKGRNELYLNKCLSE